MQVMRKIRETRRGNAAVEMAIAVPVLIAMVFGAIDFARVHFEAMVVKNASTSGSFYGAQSMQYSTDSTGIQAAATNDARGVTGFSVTNEMVCQCLNANNDFNSGVTQVSCATTCGSYGVPRVYIRTRGQKTFSTLGWYPGVPRDTGMDMSGWVRVQ